MKDYGKVIKFDGYVGIIIDKEGKEFLLLKQEIVENNKIQEGDSVIFNPEIYENGIIKKDIARFVKILKK